MTFYAHVRSSRLATTGSRRRGKGSTKKGCLLWMAVADGGGGDGGEGSGTQRGVDARWHAPVHCRHIRLEVMAFFSTLPARMCARTYTIVS